MANTLFLNQQQVFNGLGTLTYTVTASKVYNVRVDCTVPTALAQGDGAGSGTGLGSGSGGGTLGGFALGGGGLTKGAVGQGFGADTAGYPQPYASGSNETSGTAVASGVSIVVKNGASTIFTAPVITPTQGEVLFKYVFSAVAADVITVVIASATASDNGLNGVKSKVSINEGI